VLRGLDMAGVELADIFRLRRRELARSGLRPEQWKVVDAVLSCRTADRGGYKSECDSCGAVVIQYRSCRNRHCPKCQSKPTHRWLESQKANLLPVPYFHVVFTLPHLIHALFAKNERVLFDALFFAAKKTLLSLGEEKLGARLGVTSVLHTWGQQLTRHIHLHCIVTGGGLSVGRDRWVGSYEDYLFDVYEMSATFRDVYLSRLRRAFSEGDLEAEAETFQDVVAALSKRKWVVYSKQPFSGPEKVLAYLSRYTHRVAITNRRIEAIDDGDVIFAYRDYRDDKLKRCRLSIDRFIKRFLLHVVPKGYVKIRHFGLHAGRDRQQKLALCRELLAYDEPPLEAETFEAFLLRVMGIDVTRCPVCGQGTLQPRGEVMPPGGWSQRKVA
jgi:hypothetical protein